MTIERPSSPAEARAWIDDREQRIMAMKRALVDVLADHHEVLWMQPMTLVEIAGAMLLTITQEEARRAELVAMLATGLAKIAEVDPADVLQRLLAAQKPAGSA